MTVYVYAQTLKNLVSYREDQCAMLKTILNLGEKQKRITSATRQTPCACSRHSVLPLPSASSDFSLKINEHVKLNGRLSLHDPITHKAHAGSRVAFLKMGCGTGTE